MAKLWLLPLMTLVTSWMVKVEGHGRMIWPPSRASAWRLGLSSAPPDYDDNQSYCGGRTVQWEKNLAKCGICGDDFSQSQPRDHERPSGKYVIKGDNFILSDFSMNGEINVKIQITASHKGYFEFFLCSVDSLVTAADATWDCLQQQRLSLTNGDVRYGNDVILDHWGVTMMHNVSLKLPEGLVCKHCVLQWRYTTNNSPGVAPEMFYSCADISIVGKDVVSPPPPPVYIPPEIQTQVDKFPYQLTRWDNATIDFYKCNYCMPKMFESWLNPTVALPAACATTQFGACRRTG